MRAQLTTEPTRAQVAFDVAMGILVPVTCFIMDPLAFNDRGMFARYRVFVYVGALLAMPALALWLLRRLRWRGGMGVFAGMFFYCALFGAALGLALLPFTLLGLLIVIGVLGLTPFAAGFVFWRNGMRALALAQIQTAGRPVRMLPAIVTGLALVILIPGLAQQRTTLLVEESVRAVLSADPLAAESGVRRLQGAYWCRADCFDEIVFAHQREANETRRKVLAKAYREVTGQEIQSRLLDFAD